MRCLAHPLPEFACHPSQDEVGRDDAVAALVGIVAFEVETDTSTMLSADVLHHIRHPFNNLQIGLRRVLRDYNIANLWRLLPVRSPINQHLIPRFEQRKHRGSGNAIAPPEPQNPKKQFFEIAFVHLGYR